MKSLVMQWHYEGLHMRQQVGGQIAVQIAPGAAGSMLEAVTSPVFAVTVAIFVPVAMILFGVSLSALSIAFKWGVAGHVTPGVHK